jgi:2-haloalkanoic acid dehalogenase, type II
MFCNRTGVKPEPSRIQAKDCATSSIFGKGLLMKPVLVFDVNETLLDVKFLQPSFDRIFGNRCALKEWFDAVILYSQTLSIIDQYQDFSDLAKNALYMVASAKGVVISDADEREVLEGMRSLPAHPEVRGALEILRAAGFRLAALTNSTRVAVEEQLKGSGLVDHFERVLSVDAVQRYKPAPETYAYACAELGTQPAETVMIASHPWDIKGAIHAGFQGAFVRRPGTSWFGTGATPKFTEPDLKRLAESLLAAYGETSDL